MMERRQRLRLTYILVDLLTANVAFLLFDICRYCMLGSEVTAIRLVLYLLTPKLILEQLLLPMIAVCVYGISGFYNNPEQRSRISELISTFLSSLFLGIVFYFGLLVNDVGYRKMDHYLMVGCLCGIYFVVTYIGRYIVTTALFREIRRGNIRFNTVIIGNSRRARKVAQQLVRTQSLYGYNIMGYVPVAGESSAPGEVPLLSIEDLKSLVDNKRISDIVIALQDENNEHTVLAVMNILFRFDVRIKVAAGSFSYLTSGIRLQDIYGEPLLEVSCSRLSDCARNLKRLGDIVLSSFALLVLAVPMAVLAIAVKLDSHGPAFYSQERIGYRRRTFRIHKFRTMVPEAEEEGPQLTHDGDSRVTRLGRVLRKYRLDELPQFWNVLRGEMSLVGPRPERAYYIEKILHTAPYYTLLQQVRPGLTSWGMVKFGYATSVEEMVQRAKYDLIYVGNMSLTVDLKIMIFTVRTVLTGQGK